MQSAYFWPELIVLFLCVCGSLRYGGWGMACKRCICTYPQLEEVNVGTLMGMWSTTEGVRSVGTGRCADLGPSLDLILQFLMLASSTFITYKAGAGLGFF